VSSNEQNEHFQVREKPNEVKHLVASPLEILEKTSFPNSIKSISKGFRFIHLTLKLITVSTNTDG
jgi:hypothetical protein